MGIKIPARVAQELQKADRLAPPEELQSPGCLPPAVKLAPLGHRLVLCMWIPRLESLPQLSPRWETLFPVYV